MKRAWEPRGGCVERFFLLRNQDALASLFADPCQDKSRGKQGHNRRGKEEARRRQEPELSLFWTIPVKKRSISGKTIPCTWVRPLQWKQVKACLLLPCLPHDIPTPSMVPTAQLVITPAVLHSLPCPPDLFPVQSLKIRP